MTPLLPMRPVRRWRAFLALAALCLLGAFAAAPARAYVLEEYKWPAGDIVMYLQLGSASGLIDGAASWDDVAESALAIWNPSLDSVQFKVATITTSNVSGDRKNSVFFSGTVFGNSFGSDTLAITRTYYTGTTSVESDVVCNTAVKFNSYRGPLRTASGGGSLIDLRRVLLHEFGHVLGLDHTVQGSQSIMAPAVTNIDTIQADDIAGVAFLYGGPAPVSAPVISSATSANGRAGKSFSYQITATNSPTSYGAGGLPAGLSCNPSTGLISGSPTTAGTYSVTLSATNSVGTGTAALALTLDVAIPVPVITSVLFPVAMAGTAFTFQITATNSPTSYGASGLPVGLTCNPSTGLISGTPAAAGTFPLVLSATNAGGTGTVERTLGVAFQSSTEMPVITSAPTATAVAGTPFSYQITATNLPLSFNAYGLPAGLSFSTSGLISGSPVLPGTYSVTLSVYNYGPRSGTATLTLTVLPAHPAFFGSEIPLGSGSYYLSFPNGNFFGYYSYLSDPHYIYHYDMGFEYWFDAADGHGGIYFYDFTSGDWLYTSPAFGFPYLYDFKLQAFLYYYPNPGNSLHYNTGGVRYFYNFSTGQVITR